MNPTLEQLTLSQGVKEIAHGTMTSEALVSAVLHRADHTEPLVHAYAAMNPERVLEEARRLDRELSSGVCPGVLHGVPVGVKDVFQTDDLPTAAGSRVIHVEGGPDAVVVRRLRQSGAVIVGKHAMHELGLGLGNPPTKSPWRADFYAGGSTIGGAVSVAVGSSLGAIGTDAGGSVRKPAALNGVVGLKPTYGRISRRGVVPPTTSLDHVGVIGRSVEDCARLLQALAGHEPGDTTTYPVPVPDYLAGLDSGADQPRIGLPAAWLIGQIHPEVQSSLDGALDNLERIGAEIVVVRTPALDVLQSVHGILTATEAHLQHQRFLAETPDLYTTQARRALQVGALVPDAVVRAARAARLRLRDATAEIYRNHQLLALVTPTLTLPSQPLATFDPTRQLLEYSRLTMPFNVTGQPAISVPCGIGKAGLPMGIQLIGRPFDEQSLLRVAHSLYLQSPWGQRQPPMK